MNRLLELYKKSVIPKMKEKFGFKNDLRVPKLDKIIVGVGISSSISDSKMVEAIERNLMAITGQKPVATLAKKAISGFKIKKGQQVGLKVTLRGKRMYDFLDKLINIALPRTKDFKGVSSSFDGRGNLTLGFKEQIAFPEVSEGATELFGLEITITTTTKEDKEAKELLTLMGMPFKE
jgi:large subunit ribosomal protein L5|uniref:Large ribosomal subunit protein uL5 n=1 Tax=candidate division CPR3 bacterium TaxID=2268181 RepID=A0A7V3JA68_UNCC3